MLSELIVKCGMRFRRFVRILEDGIDRKRSICLMFSRIGLPLGLKVFFPSRWGIAGFRGLSLCS